MRQEIVVPESAIKALVRIAMETAGKGVEKVSFKLSEEEGENRLTFKAIVTLKEAIRT